MISSDMFSPDAAERATFHAKGVTYHSLKAVKADTQTLCFGRQPRAMAGQYNLPACWSTPPPSKI